MKSKLMAAGIAMALAAGIALNGAFDSRMPVASAAFGVCDSQFVKNVRLKALGNSDFEVAWDYTPPDPCLTPQEFKVTVEARRNVGGDLLGTKTITAKGNERRAVAEFRSVFGINLVSATVTPTVTIKPLAATGSLKP